MTLLMKSTGYTLDEIERIQGLHGVGNTPLLELRNITKLARKYAKPGFGARIFAKDESCNASGSFKDRRAACAVAHAKKLGYKGVMAATSGNYGGGCFSGRDAGIKLHHRPGMLRLPWCRTTGDR